MCIHATGSIYGPVLLKFCKNIQQIYIYWMSSFNKKLEHSNRSLWGNFVFGNFYFLL